MQSATSTLAIVLPDITVKYELLGFCRMRLQVLLMQHLFHNQRERSWFQCKSCFFPCRRAPTSQISPLLCSLRPQCAGYRYCLWEWFIWAWLRLFSRRRREFNERARLPTQQHVERKCEADKLFTNKRSQIPDHKLLLFWHVFELWGKIISQNAMQHWGRSIWCRGIAPHKEILITPSV